MRAPTKLPRTVFTFLCLILSNSVLATQAESDSVNANRGTAGEQEVGTQTRQPEPSQHTSTNTKIGEVGSNKSGYKNVPEFGGPNSVVGTLKEDDTVKESLFRFDGMQRLLKPYFDFKAQVKEDYGLAFGADYTALYQWANKSPGSNDAAGGIFRFFGDWTMCISPAGMRANVNRRKRRTAGESLFLLQPFLVTSGCPFYAVDTPRMEVLSGRER